VWLAFCHFNLEPIELVQLPVFLVEPTIPYVFFLHFLFKKLIFKSLVPSRSVQFSKLCKTNRYNSLVRYQTRGDSYIYIDIYISNKKLKEALSNLIYKIKNIARDEIYNCFDNKLLVINNYGIFLCTKLTFLYILFFREKTTQLISTLRNSTKHLCLKQIK